MNKKRAFLFVQARHQWLWLEAFAQGLRRHGWEALTSETPIGADLLVQWGVKGRTINRYKASGLEICVLERGPIDFPDFMTVSFGGELSRRAKFRGPFTDSSRWKQYFDGRLKEWKPPDKDGQAIVMAQVPTDAACVGVNMRAWPEQTAQYLRDQGIRATVRPHPNIVRNMEPIEQALKTASAVVTWNSTSAVDAVLAGVPAVALDAGSMAYDVASHSLDVLDFKPDRTAWSHWLAWCQYTFQEIKSGYCWDIVGNDHAR